MILTLLVFRNGQSSIMVLQFSSFSRVWACRQHDEELVHIGTSPCCLSLQSPSLTPTLDALSMHIRRANYQAAIWHRALQPRRSLNSWPTWLLGWLCKPEPECGDDLASHSSVEIQWMTRPAAPQALLDLIKCG